MDNTFDQYFQVGWFSKLLKYSDYLEYYYVYIGVVVKRILNLLISFEIL